jgi:hypothetical protein
MKIKVGMTIADTWTVLEVVKTHPCAVYVVQDNAGNKGYLKRRAHVSGDGEPTYARKRFLAEYKIMAEFDGREGVLPLLDRDGRSNPEWFVTKAVTPLTEAVDGAGLYDIVEVVAALSDTLAGIKQDTDITHRDLKPANLFWDGSKPLLGDFGIANHPDHEALNLTDGKLGSWGYLSPEGLNNVGDVQNWAPSDVYSMAKCLWKFAKGLPYPHPGTLYIIEPPTSLYGMGGTPALNLARLLEDATSYDPARRPSMKAFAAELRSWLARHDPADVKPPIRLHPVPFESATVHRQRMISKRGEEAIARDVLLALLRPLRHLHGELSEAVAVSAGELALPDHLSARLSGGDPDWEPEGAVVTWALTWPDEPSLRVLAQAVDDGQITYFYAQWQRREGEDWTPASDVDATTGVPWWPSCRDNLDALATRLEAADPSLAQGDWAQQQRS